MKRNEGESMDEYRARRRADKQAARIKLRGRWAWYSGAYTGGSYNSRPVNWGSYCKVKHGELI